MKQNYEFPYLLRLPMRMPVILRIDGRNFHTFTKDMDRPYDAVFIESMKNLALYLCEEIQGAELAYLQSDEISILIHNYKRLTSQAPFNNEIQKLCSISAGLASGWFTGSYKRIAVFDARVFVLPETEVTNYFLWRQLDATRNSISMLAHSLYSHKELQGKNSTEKQEMIFQKGKNWNALPAWLKRGICIKNGVADMDIPIFSQNRNYIEEVLKVDEE